MYRPCALVLGLLLSYSFAQAGPRNIILMIGDGMGQSHLTAYRHMQHLGGGTDVPTTLFDDFLVGMSSTHPHDDTVVTDSAASATALATGHKTCNQAVSVSCDGNSLSTLFQAAKARGMLTSVVVSSQVNHATPAAFYAHQRSRQDYDAIADQLLDNRMSEQLPVDVIMGGGTRYFIRNDRNLAQELEAEGYQYADSWESFRQLTRAPALALLAEIGLPSALDTPEPRALASMTDRALTLLKKADKGFVIMIEGSQIDWCSHANDIACAMAEMDDFHQSVAVAKAFVDANPDTLLLITADHETGGLSLGTNNEYQWKANVVRGITRTTDSLSQKLMAVDEWEAVWKSHTGLELSKEEKATLTKARTKDRLADAIRAIVNQRSHTGWTSLGHTAEDVPIMAYGAGSEHFHGFLDNAEIGRRLLKLIQQ